jgi:hypothetical protein
VSGRSVEGRKCDSESSKIRGEMNGREGVASVTTDIFCDFGATEPCNEKTKYKTQDVESRERLFPSVTCQRTAPCESDTR